MNDLDQSYLKKKHWLGETPKDRRNNVIVILLVVVLIAMAGLYFAQRGEHRSIVNHINIQKDSIQTELNRMVAGYDSLKTDNDTINRQLYVAQTKVKDLLLEVEHTRRVSFEKITLYQKEVTTLRGIMRDYVVQIDSLNRRNQMLLAENQEVKEQYKKVENEKQQLSQEKEQLEQNLERAAMLEARDLIATGLNDRSKETKYARRTEMIQINFTLSKNVTTKRGAKNIYVRIMRPDQLLLNKSPDDLFKFEDLKIQFTAMREVNYEGDELPVNIYWDNKGQPELNPGEYDIEVFADGNNIGSTTLVLK